MILNRLFVIGYIVFIVLIDAKILFAASAPSIRFVRTITETGGEALFRDPLQMSLQGKAGEVAVSNAGKGDVVVMRISDEKVLLRINRRAGLKNPFGVLLHANKSILIGELKGGEIKYFGPTGVLKRSWDLSKATGGLVRPGRIRSLDEGGYLVIDRQNDQVLILNRDGTIKRAIKGQKRLDQIQDAVFGPEGRLYVLCNGGQTVRVFSREGQFLFGFGKHAGSPDNFSFPCALAFDGKQRLWIVDAFQHMLKVFTKEGSFLFQFGGIGLDPMKLFFPRDMAFDDQGRLWVLEKGANRIKIYDVEDLKK